MAVALVMNVPRSLPIMAGRAEHLAGALPGIEMFQVAGPTLGTHRLRPAQVHREQRVEGAEVGEGEECGHRLAPFPRFPRLARGREHRQCQRF